MHIMRARNERKTVSTNSIRTVANQNKTWCAIECGARAGDRYGMHNDAFVRN